MSLYLRTGNKYNLSHIYNFCRYCTTSEVITQNDQAIVEDDSLAREAEIQQKRNKSGLTKAHFNLVNGRRPYEVPKALAHLTVKYSRKMYGQYGSASGINPSLCWPSMSDIQEAKEYETVAFPYTIKEMMEQVAKQREEKKLKILQRDAEVAAKFEKLEQWKKELNDKINKKCEETRAAKEKKERLVEEVRRHFGFKLDPRDERFQEMLAKREKEQKKLEKQARKEAREKQLIAKLQQKSAEIADKS
ncbi:Growth arrest and DNA damage-inducible proteins-interacting protein 1 [Eumeta japonica]|uniref:Large ribosomal subunit protein mL64 n=1 Tax=Eumeta variegata TaxID=151549 RepID=A0A4C1T1Y0_EUMVA|nr:Growth arrest and DNA damage-inducible proteins-interacting protein 1 [Eumeta japonica]